MASRQAVSSDPCPPSEIALDGLAASAQNLLQGEAWADATSGSLRTASDASIRAGHNSVPTALVERDAEWPLRRDK